MARNRKKSAQTAGVEQLEFDLFGDADVLDTLGNAIEQTVVNVFPSAAEQQTTQSNAGRTDHGTQDIQFTGRVGRAEAAVQVAFLTESVD